MKGDHFYLQLIKEYIEDIERYTHDGKRHFMDNDMVQNATLRQLQVMAESTQRLSDKTKIKQPDIPRQVIADFRNVLVHNYDDRINLEMSGLR